MLRGSTGECERASFRREYLQFCQRDRAATITDLHVPALATQNRPELAELPGQTGEPETGQSKVRSSVNGSVNISDFQRFGWGGTITDPHVPALATPNRPETILHTSPYGST